MPLPASRRVLLLVQYDGTDFKGWQRQLGQRTVQETLEAAITRFTKGETFSVRGSSRTDAGVHAVGLPVTVPTELGIPLVGWHRGLNTLLPSDVTIMYATEASPDFDVRYSGQGKTYQYRIWNGHGPSALRARQSWWVKQPLDVALMAADAKALIGVHDFSAYRSSGCQSKSPVRHVTDVRVEGSARGEITVTVEGNAFLQHMVRIIVGTLVDIGRGYREPGFAAQALASRDRRKGGPTAPGQGLCLMRVHYDPDPYSRPDTEPEPRT